MPDVGCTGGDRRGLTSNSILTSRQTVEARGSHPTTDTSPPCPECAQPQGYDDDSARFSCGNGQCVRFGMDTPVWRALEEAGVALAPVTGLPRPVRHGLPVPRVAPWTSDRVWWRALHARRLARAHHQWRCQMCGELLPEKAWVLAAPSGTVLQAALHDAPRPEPLPRGDRGEQERAHPAPSANGRV